MNTMAPPLAGIIGMGLWRFLIFDALVAWGDAGYAAAVADAKARSGATELADVRADTTFFNILFLYDKACTRVTAKAIR